MTRSTCTSSFGIELGDIDMGSVEALGVGANWGRVPPGTALRPAPARRDRDVRHRRRGRRPGRGRQADAGQPRHGAPVRAVRDALPGQHRQPTTCCSRPSTGGTRRAPRKAAARAGPPAVRRPAGLRVLHAAHAQRRAAHRPPVRALPGHRRLRPVPADERHRVWHLAATDDFQSYVAECARREGRTPGEVARALRRRDRRDAGADGHPPRPGHAYQHGRAVPGRRCGRSSPGW